MTASRKPGTLRIRRTGSQGKEFRAVAGQEPDAAVGVQASERVGFRGFSLDIHWYFNGLLLKTGFP